MEKKGRKHSKSSCIFVWQKTEDDFFFNYLLYVFCSISFKSSRRCIYYFCNYKNIKEQSQLQIKKKRNNKIENPAVSSSHSLQMPKLYSKQVRQQTGRKRLHFKLRVMKTTGFLMLKRNKNFSCPTYQNIVWKFTNQTFSIRKFKLTHQIISSQASRKFTRNTLKINNCFFTALDKSMPAHVSTQCNTHNLQ